MAKLDFKIDIIYFKPSGRYYTEGEFTCPCTNCGTETHPSCYMADAVEALKQMHIAGEMPGLQSGRWNGFLMIDCDLGFPVLIKPGDFEE